MIFVFVLMLSMPVGSGAVGQASARISGTAFDQVGGLLPYVGITVTNKTSMAHREVRTDQQGHYEIEGLTAGEYILEAERSGFDTFQESLKLEGDHLEQDVTLQIAPIEERMTVADSDPSSVSNPRDEPRGVETCEISAVGGDLRRPLRVRGARPEYPRQLRDARIKGSVVVSGRVSTDGRLKDARVQTASHPDLGDASIAALTDWQWTAPRLDCVPVEISISLTIDFVLRP